MRKTALRLGAALFGVVLAAALAYTRPLDLNMGDFDYLLAFLVYGMVLDIPVSIAAGALHFLLYDWFEEE